MKKYIYKITNLIDGKIYIGQTNNPKERWKEHQRLGSLTYINQKNRHSHLYLAMKKHGIQNFNFETIEEPCEDYNEKEQYWISYYNSYWDKTKGYNLTPGGEDPPILKGEDSPLAKYSNEVIEAIQKELIGSNKSYQQISQQYDITENYLSMINRGIARYNSTFEYPLRLNGNERKEQELIEILSFELLYTEKSIEEICRQYQIGDKVIRIVNRGEHKFCLQELNYPIRQPYKRLSNYLIQEIIKDLQGTVLKLSDIESKYNLSKSTVNRINQGKIYQRKGIQYPIRNSSNRVYN